MPGIGILGGSFNPPHLAHIKIAEAALRELKLRSVIFLPANLPPHKLKNDLAPAADRLEMVRLALAGHKGFEVSDFDLREGPAYSIDTVRHFRAEYGDTDPLYFLIGTDSLSELPSWRKIGELAALCSFVPFPRPGSAAASEESLAAAVGREEARAIIGRTIRMPPVDISSTAIRQLVSQGKPIDHLVPAPVADYIRTHNLYRIPGNPKLHPMH